MRDAIFVVGMGRSGTSALTRLLSLCGAALPRHNLEPNSANVTGYWEPKAALEINDRFLARYSSSWYDAGLSVQGHAIDPREQAAFIDEAAGVLETGFETSGPIVVKDPRISALLPYWTQAAGRVALVPKIVHIFRRPDDVAASLAAREDLPAAQSDALWLKYNLLAERDTRGFPRVFVSYEEIMRDWRSAISRCIDALGLALSISVAESEAAGFLSAELQHHATPADVPLRHGGELIERTYALLQAAVRTGRSDAPAFDDLFVAFEGARPCRA